MDPDPVDLLSGVHHVLRAIETASRYLDDARAAGDAPLAGFFERVLDANRGIAEEGRTLLDERLVQAQKREEERRLDEAIEESFPASDPPAF